MANDFFNQWSQPESDDRLDLVFADKNQKYGAFYIRSKYRKAKVMSVLIACSFVALLSAIPLIQEMGKKDGKSGSKKVKVEAKTLDEIDEPKEQKKDEPPPPEPPKPQVAMQQFQIPEFDPNTTNEAELPPNNKVLNPGDVTKQGQAEFFPTDDKDPGGPIGGTGSSDPVKADVQAKFMGGDDAFIEFVKGEFQYPGRCQDEGINGYVLLRFVVDTKGNVSNVTMMEETPSCKEFTEEAIRVLKKSPQWIPGMVSGKFVKSYRVVPIRLNLN